MNQKALKFSLFAALTGTAASTTTLGLHIWAPELGLSPYIPFGVGAATFVGLLVLSTTLLTRERERESDIAVHQKPAPITTASTPKVPMKVRYKMELKNSKEDIRNRLYLQDDMKKQHKLQDFFEREGWYEIKKEQPGYDDADVINIDIYALIGARYDGVRHKGEPNLLIFFWREPTSTSVSDESKGEFTFSGPRFDSGGYYVADSCLIERLKKVMEEKERWVRAQAKVKKSNITTESSVIVSVASQTLDQSRDTNL
ncbi:MAG: hypothetical protein JSS50_04355 [Proteobacteria bacterium]|nr:hypothetical protein [Pseudomonadota bacterium]